MRFELIIVHGQDVARAIQNAQHAVERPIVAAEAARHDLEVHQFAGVAHEGIVIVRCLAPDRVDGERAKDIEGRDDKALAVVLAAGLQRVRHRQAGQVAERLGCGQRRVRRGR